MTGSSSTGSRDREDNDVPVWARPDALPKAGSGSAFGFLDHKSVAYEAESMEELVEKAESSREGVALVWMPESEYLVVPEQVPALHDVLRGRRKKFARRDLSDGLRMGAVFGLILLWAVGSAWTRGGWEALISHQLSGLAALLFLLFGLLPLYEGWKERRQLQRGIDFSDEVPEARFDAWLERGRIPATWLLLGGLGLVCVVQLLVDGLGGGSVPLSIQKAGQLKGAAVQFPNVSDAGAWWRVVTAGVLHGNAVHFLLNAAGILYLGRRTELLVRWPHLLIVFFGSMWIGGIASASLLPNDPAVGASGGLMGLLGFMLVFESLHRRLVPRLTRRRLLAGLVLMVLMGVLGMSFIDNAAHGGGLLAGIVYAVIVFPRSATVHRPESLKKDRVVGAVVGGAFVLVCVFACLRILS